MELFINDNLIVFQNGPTEKWTLEIDKVKLIGEYTTAAGPWLDDYFFVFAEKGDEWFEVPNEAVKSHDFWETLSEKLNFKVAPSLCASTEFASKVLYSEELKGQKLLQIIRREEPASTFLQKLFRDRPSTESLTLSESVVRLLIDK